MSSILNQCAAVIMLNIRSIPQRLAMSASTVVAVALAVGVLLGFLALGNGFAATVKGSGSATTAIVIRSIEDAELNSGLGADQVAVIGTAPNVAHQGDQPIISPELYVIVNGTKRANGLEANMPFRGMGPNGLAVRSNITLVKGRMFTPGTNEIVVGEGLLREFSGFDYGHEVKIGRTTWKVVGVFSAPGSVFESELWADVRVLQSLYNRGNSYQTVRVKLQDPKQFETFKRFITDDPRVKLETAIERDYYANQSAGMGDLISYVGWPLGITMAIGALAGALNTMYSSVSARAAEIATLRIIGFSGVAAFAGTLFEALALSVLGALVGAVGSFLLFNGMTTSTLGSNFTQVVFKLQLSPGIIGVAIIIALIIGLVGGIFPGIRAARQRPQLELAAQ